MTDTEFRWMLQPQLVPAVRALQYDRGGDAVVVVVLAADDRVVLR